jgi:hypothetical protein
VHRGPSDPVEKAPAEGAAFRAVTRRRRRAPAAIALAAIAFLGVALLSKVSAPTIQTPVANVTAGPSVVAAASTSIAPTVVATAGPPAASVPPARNPTVTPHPGVVDVSVARGRTQIIPAGPTPARLTVSLPDGWERASPAMYVKPSGTAEVGLSIGAWRIQHVNLFPCRWATPAYADTLFPSTAQGQADALSAWWGQDPNKAFYSNATIAPVASKPTPATIAGHPAWYVEVLIPSDFDLSQCDGGQLVLWKTPDGSVRTGLGPDEHDRLWVVDVKGERVVIDASAPLTPSPADEAEIQAVIDSIVIQP